MAAGQEAADTKWLSAVTTGGTALSEIPSTDVFSLARGLLYFPRVAGSKKFAQVATPALGDDVLDLLVHHVFVTRHITPRAEDADGCWEIRAVFHV